MQRGLVVMLAAVVMAATSVGGSENGGRQPTHPVAVSVLKYFEARSADFDTFLREIRPPPPSAALRAAVLRTLPKEGELRPTARQAEKLAAIRAVLAFNGREHDLDIRLVDVRPRAAIGLYARAVLIVSNDAADILTAKELQAVTAHELGHEYVWDEYERARRRSDAVARQELELKCDGLAVITIDRLGLDFSDFMSAVSRLTDHNDLVGMTGTAAANYVPLDQRLHFIWAMAALIARTKRERS